MSALPNLSAACRTCSGSGSIAHGLEWCPDCHDCTECGDMGWAYRIDRGTYDCVSCAQGTAWRYRKIAQVYAERWRYALAQMGDLCPR